MFDNKVVKLINILNNEFKMLDVNANSKFMSDNLSNLIKNNFLIIDTEIVRVFYSDNFYCYKIIKENIRNVEDNNFLLGFNRVISLTGDIQEFFGIYIETFKTINDYAINCSVYMIIYFDQKLNKLCLYIPEKGNTLKSKKYLKDGKQEINYLKLDNSAYLDFSQLKIDIYNHFFVDENDFNQDLMELFDVIKILADNNKIDNLINSFNNKYFNNK